MKCGVRFCGGCNPRYDRGKAFKSLEEKLKCEVDFVIADEAVNHDLLLLIGGCTNCCASYKRFKTQNGVLRMFDEEQLEKIVEEIRKI